MVPVLLALIDAALGTKAIREEIEEGVKEGKEVTREKWERAKTENERWEAEKEIYIKEKEKDGEKGKKTKDGKLEGKKKALNEKEKRILDEEKEVRYYRTMPTHNLTSLLFQKRTAHKQVLTSLEHALQVAMTAYTARFGQLGRDPDGRVYWALSPGIVERELALDFLDDKASNGGLKKSRGGRRGILDDDGRQGMKRWSWFVAVWGRGPPVQVSESGRPKQMNADTDSEDGDDNEEKWWGFGEPEEIRRLAGYIGRQSGLEDYDDSSDTVKDKRSDSGSGSRSRELSLTPLDDNIDIFMRDPPPTKGELKGLIRSLKDYADLLEWRIKLVKADEKGERNLRVVDAGKFYS
jgi:hypothetical protein